MFGGDERTPTDRYRVRIVAGEYRVKSHQNKVQEALDEGSSRGWRLVSASTTSASGIYWDTVGPDR